MKIIIATRDLDYGVGSVVKTELKKFDNDKKINKINVIGPKKLEGYSDKVNFDIIENIGIYFVTKQPNFAFKCNRKIKEIIKKEKIDEIYLHYPIYANKYGPKLIAKFHILNKSISKNYPFGFKMMIGYFFHRLYSYFDYRTIRYADKVLFVSERTLKEAEEYFPKYKDKFEFSQNEVDKNKFFKVSKKEKLKLKKELGVNDGKENLLFVGRLEPMKGILNLIKTIKEQNNENIRLMVVGDGPLKKEVQKYLFVKYFGKIPNEEMYKFYNVADLFILPSKYENSPMTILEAKECGCDVLTKLEDIENGNRY